MTHGDFMDENGAFDEVTGRKRAEEKVQCSWAFVECNGTPPTPKFRVDIDSDTYDAVCHKCGSKYYVFQGNGTPLSGNALELKYGLKQYRATHLGMGYGISN